MGEARSRSSAAEEMGVARVDAADSGESPGPATVVHCTCSTPGNGVSGVVRSRGLEGERHRGKNGRWGGIGEVVVDREVVFAGGRTRRAFSPSSGLPGLISSDKELTRR